MMMADELILCREHSLLLKVFAWLTLFLFFFSPIQLLLNHLPLDRTTWPSYLEKQRAMYRGWVTELVVDPHSKNVRTEFSCLLIITFDFLHEQPIGISLIGQAQSSAPQDVSHDDHVRAHSC